MRKFICTLAAALLCNLVPSAEAGGTNAAAQLAQAPLRSSQQPVSEIRTAMTQGGTVVSRGQIAVCANLAAIRAMGAKAAGSDYPTQSRILDLTFVLCLAGSPTED